MDTILDIRHLHKSYRKNRGIEDVNLKVSKGKIYGFVGPNGAGKSTTIKILLDFIRSDQGEAKILGLDCQNDAQKIKKHIGYVSSDVRYYSFMTIHDIILQTLSFYNLEYSHDIGDMTQYLQMDVTKKIGQLSLGNKKKVAIICALIHHPEFIILDEPTSGLDPLIQKRLFELLSKEVKNGATVFLSSHNLTEVENYCDEVAFIKEGKIIKIQNLKEEKYQHSKSVMIKGKNIPVQLFEELDINEFHHDDYVTSFIYKGDISLLMKTLSSLDIDDLVIDNLSLEEEFMNYYQEDDQ